MTRSASFRIAAAATVVAAVALPATAEPPGDDARLDRALARLARVATLYRDQALRFTCNERIYATGAEDSELRRFRYVYRYSDEAGGFLDVRIPRDEAPTAAAIERSQDENYGFPALLTRAYSWVFVFDEPNQDAYRFRLVGDGEVLNRPALGIGFEARPPYDPDVDAWCGTAWIDRETSQLLRVEAVAIEECPTVAAYEKKLAGPVDDAGQVAWFAFSRFETDFDVKKNGLRLPGRTVIDRRLHQLTAARGRIHDHAEPVYRVSQTYSRYRFFSVRTRDEMRRIVEGDAGD